MPGTIPAPSFTLWATPKLWKCVRQQSRHQVLCENWPRATTTPEQGSHSAHTPQRAGKSPGTAKTLQLSAPVLPKAFILPPSKYKYRKHLGCFFFLFLSSVEPGVWKSLFHERSMNFEPRSVQEEKRVNTATSTTYIKSLDNVLATWNRISPLKCQTLRNNTL